MPKLPADLPENWTRGQLVSPNGTEVGLTEKHGYNYLMKQVNNTQTEVNNINTALTDVAQQATVNEINNKIGTESDADTQPTLFGRLAELKKVLTEKLTELLTKVTGMDGKIGTNEDSAGTSTLFGQVKDISEKMPTGIVKSIQEISINESNCDSTDDFNPYKDYTISPVVKEKTIVLANCNLKMDNIYWTPVAKVLNSNTVRVYKTVSANDRILRVYVQIVEFF